MNALMTKTSGHCAASELQSLMFQALPAGQSYALLQGYPFTGLVRLKEGRIELPPSTNLDPARIPWEQFFDIRAFAPEAMLEWHAWRLASGEWGYHTRSEGEYAEDDRIPRDYVLWGTYADLTKDGWSLYQDTGRGTEIWVPAEQANQAKHLALRVVQLLGPLSAEGSQGIPRIAPLWGVEDAMIIAFTKIEQR